MTQKYSVTDCIKGNVNFLWYRDGELWYECANGFEFPVPTNDAAGAIFHATDKGILFMRWIRKHLKMLEDAKNEQSV